MGMITKFKLFENLKEYYNVGDYIILETKEISTTNKHYFICF